MKQRCRNPNHKKDYYLYGGRGISVCLEWTKSNEFIKWAIENGYKEGLTLDRINPDGNYEPSNCKWSTWKEQANNRRDIYRIKDKKQFSLKRHLKKTRKTNSGYFGVYKATSNKYKYKKWRSMIYKDGKSYFVGCFLTKEEAARAWDSKARELYGNCAKTNF